MKKRSINAVIANGGTASAAVNIGDQSVVGMKLPAALTGTAITFTMCDTVDGTYVAVHNSAGALSYTVAASRYMAIDPVNFYGIKFLKVVSGSAEGAERTIQLSLKDIE